MAASVRPLHALGRGTRGDAAGALDRAACGRDAAGRDATEQPSATRSPVPERNHRPAASGRNTLPPTRRQPHPAKAGRCFVAIVRPRAWPSVRCRSDCNCSGPSRPSMAASKRRRPSTGARSMLARPTATSMPSGSPTANNLGRADRPGIYGRAAAVRDGRVYIGDNEGLFYCVNGRSGKVKWRYKTGYRINAMRQLRRRLRALRVPRFLSLLPAGGDGRGGLEVSRRAMQSGRFPRSAAAESTPPAAIPSCMSSIWAAGRRPPRLVSPGPRVVPPPCWAIPSSWAATTTS